jgi:HD-GYP domain-containing protein (c-di-GMP phosphodiesterase class II)
MRTKLGVENLSVGMYVCALDRPWLESPFGLGPFTIDSTECLQRLRTLCEFVYVDNSAVREASGLDGDTDFERPELELEMLRHYAQPAAGPSRYPDQSDLEQELPHADRAYAIASSAISTLLKAAQLGVPLNIPGLRQALKPMLDSIVRNPDALLWRIRAQPGEDALPAHSLRVCVLALAFGRHLGWEPGELEAIGLGGLLHDVGFVRLPGTIADHPGETEHDPPILAQHVEYGATMLAGIPDLRPTTLEFVHNHHRYLDGSGYPRDTISAMPSTSGKIAAIVHEFDRLTRPFNPGGALPEHLALKVLYRDRGVRFDIHLVEDFVRCIGIYPLGSVVELLNGDIGVVLAFNRDRRLRPRVALTPVRVDAPDSTPPSLDVATLLAAPSTECEIARLAQERIQNRIRPVDYVPIGR